MMEGLSVEEGLHPYDWILAATATSCKMMMDLEVLHLNLEIH